MKVIGLTGGPGMGKSAIERLLQERQVPVVDTDSLARALVAPGQPALNDIAAVFGTGVVSPGGELDRHQLAAIVFNDPRARARLESILHPRIRALWKHQIHSWRSTGAAKAFVAIPLLFETRAEPEFDEIVCVACRQSSQRARLAQRGWTAEQIKQRIESQWPIEDKVARSDFVVWTEGPLDVTAAQVERILAQL